MEAIIRISESLAKITLSTVVLETHVDEAIRLFNVSTMNAVNLGICEIIIIEAEGNTNQEIESIRQHICRRLPHGSRISYAALLNNLKEVFNSYIGVFKRFNR